MTEHIHVVVAVITQQQNVLVSLRPTDVHMGGLWEFPGGKCEVGESARDALNRELQEELAIMVLQCRPMMQIRHEYPDKTVLLDIWEVTDFQGEPRGNEGQRVEWHNIATLNPVDFPQANRAIIRRLQLPAQFMITGKFENQTDFLQRLQQSLQNGIRLVQLRAKGLATDELIQLSGAAHPLCQQYGASLLVNTDKETISQCSCDGLHLTSQQLHQYPHRPVNAQMFLSASCHTEDDLRHATLLQADLLLLSPVKPTTSHPGEPGIGWDKFEQMIKSVSTPVYALGGMSADDIDEAQQRGAQGVAAISSFWGVSQL